MHAGAPRRGALSSSPAPKTPARTLRGGLASHRPPPSRGKALPVRGGMMAAANVTSLRGRRSIAKAGTVVRATWKPLSSRGGLASPSAASSRVSRSPLARYPGSAPSTTIPRPLTVTRRRADPPIDLTGDSEPSAQRSAARARPSSPRPCTVLRSPRPYLSPPAGQPVVRLTPAAAAEPGVVTPSVKVSPSEGPPPASTILSVKERMEVLKASLEAAAEAGKAAPTVTEHASGQLCQRTRDPSASEQRDPDTKDSPSPRPDSATDRGAGERLPTLSPEERASLATSVLSFISHELKAAALSRMYLCR
ncbi:hypothetical protein FOL47_000553 [Perkinsus chesapeaki]|uniref:Uncharacterized protein n=1 Tax=Perkinsus chesapeaki TaxID=330153 RepID=A0A7J6N115_PERCH|nr:hypothetical protein FOL47_000553 [Perkinsus chesapeaki]